MSIRFLLKSLLLLLLLLSPPPAAVTGGGVSEGICVAASRPLEPGLGPKYVKMKPEKGQGSSQGTVEACLPKGFRRSSAPSRYTNYQPLGSSCFSGKVVKNGP